jgi:hypothetical protein
MTFSEADAQYEVIKQQYLAGALDEEQFDEQLHRLMVLDDAGLWWAKSRENGSWHYYDLGKGDWIAATPPASTPEVPSPPLLPSAPAAEPRAKRAKTVESRAVDSTPPADGTSESNLPRWAAVKPAAGTTAASTGAAAATPSAGRSTPGSETALPSTSQGSPATANYSARDFGPIAELTGGMKVLFYILALLLPILGLILFFVYRNKPAQADRTAARAFLILGIASIVFSCMCSTTFFLLESTFLGTGTRP